MLAHIVGQTSDLTGRPLLKDMLSLLRLLQSRGRLAKTLRQHKLALADLLDIGIGSKYSTYACTIGIVESTG